ncbi:MAG: HDOD domain-containing protein [Desulfobulbus sp.]|jgi:HD-like signal output (HDOD) protein
MPSTTILIERFKKIRTLPHSVTKLMQLINNEDSTLQDFEAVIRLDPVLVGRLLTLVNNSYFGLRKKVDSISRAVALLGMKNLHNIAITDAIQGMLSNRSGGVQFFPQQLWRHSAAVSICCKMISERIFEINGDDAYLCGILHDIGLIVEMEVEQELFLKLIDRLTPDSPPLISLERELFQTDHCRIGSILARDWHIPEAIAEALAFHHDHSGSVAPRSPRGILQMSEYIVHQLHIPALKEGLPSPLAPSLAAHIQENMEEYQVLAEDLPEELAITNSMYGS